MEGKPKPTGIFVYIDPAVDAFIPRGLNAQFPCCVARSSSCLRSLCTRPLHPSNPIGWDTLNLVHTREYLQRLQNDPAELRNIFGMEVGATDDLTYMLTPLRYQVACTWLVAQHATQHKTMAVSVEGCMPHASPTGGSGSCVFCDVPLAWLLVRDKLKSQGVTKPKALYIDFDVHRAQGVADARVQLQMEKHFFMLDLYNEDIYPEREQGDHPANIELSFHNKVRNRDYLNLVSEGLERAAREVPRVNLVFYMCCMDALAGDPLGKTNVTESAIYERDRMVIQWARDRSLPVAILISRGFGRSSCRVARESLARLNDEFSIFETKEVKETK